MPRENEGANFADSSYHLLHIDAQNACLLTYKVPEKIIFEISEVSPSNEAANLTKGRLIRSFPDVAVAIPLQTFQEEGFVATVANTLFKMANRESNIFPQRGGSTSNDQSSQDTTACTLVTDVFGAFLLSLGQPACIREIVKHTRNEVISSGRSRPLPWRRTPIWDLMKICLQTIMCRETETGLQTYKRFMLFFMTQLLEKANLDNLENDILVVMRAKIAKRLVKMGKTFSAPWLHQVRLTMEKTSNIILQRVEKIQLHCEQRSAVPSLSNLKWDGAGTFVFEELEEFLPVYTSPPPTREPDNHHSRLPGLGLWQLHDLLLPNLTNAEGDESLLVSNLATFERWIASNLDAWISNNFRHVSTPAKLSELAEEYFKRAQPAYQGYPEGISKMYLTVLEIAIACDKAVCQAYPMLTEYPIPIPSDICSNLLIGSGSGLQRLNTIEAYLEKRSLQKEIHQRDILFKFGEKESFAVRFYQQSSLLKTRLTEIRKRAKALEDSKLKEFHDIQTKRGDLIQMSRGLSHEEQQTLGGQLVHDETKCRHCCLKRRADTLFSIRPWQRLLPESETDQWALVFELNVPSGFGEWRDIMAFVIDEVLGLRTQASEKANRPRGVEEFNGLTEYAHNPRTIQRVTLACESSQIASTTADITVTERTRESDVCLNHGIRWGVFDKKKQLFTSVLASTDKVAKLCTFKLPARSQDHQDLLLRSQIAPNGVSPNEVIARQSICPEHFTPSEYQALLTCSLGHRIQWRNVVLELASDKIDLQKTETALILSQIALQAGPAPTSTTIRPAHEDLEVAEFVQHLVDNLGIKMEQVSENWQACRVIALITVLATRIKSASGNTMLCVDDLLDACRDLLHRQLVKAFSDYGRIGVVETGDDKNSSDLTRDSQDSINTDELKSKFNKEMNIKRLEISLACLNTFSLDDNALRDALQDPAKIQIFLECAMAVHDSESSLEWLDEFQKLLLWRWRQLVPNAAFILAEHELSQQQSGLTAAIRSSWPSFQNVIPWTFKGSRWLATTAVVREKEEPREVHFDILTAELYFDGLPASSVPAEYLSRPNFSNLFHNMDLSVLPTNADHGVRLPLCLKSEPNGHKVHLGLSRGQLKHLLVLAEKDDVQYALVPSALISGILPDSVQASYICWYNLKSCRVEFRSHKDPWNCASILWSLVQVSNG